MKLLVFMTKNVTVLVCLCFLISSCKKKETPVTVQEAKDFARQLEVSIEKRNPDFFNRAIDNNTFLKKAGLNSGKNARAFGSGLKESLKMGTKMTQSISEKATYQMVKQYEKNGVQHVLFRLYDDGSLNYHDIELVKTGNETKAADIFIYASGEYLSETMNGVFEQFKGMGENDSPEEKKWISKMPDMRKLMAAGKSEEAIEIYDHLPLKIQKMRAVQIMHVMIASKLEDEELYLDAIEQYKKLYPDEPNMHLLLLDGYIISKEYDKALHSVNEMDRMINKDPFLDYYRYLIYNLKEDKENSRVHLEKLVKNMPGFEEGIIELIAFYLEEKNDTAANEWIKKFRQKGSFDQERLDAVIENSKYYQ